MNAGERSLLHASGELSVYLKSSSTPTSLFSLSLKKKQNNSLHLQGVRSDVKFIACTPATTQLSLIGIFLANSVHRVYVVDDLAAPRPTAVVTPTDVFRVLAGVF